MLINGKTFINVQLRTKCLGTNLRRIRHLSKYVLYIDDAHLYFYFYVMSARNLTSHFKTAKDVFNERIQMVNISCIRNLWNMGKKEPRQELAFSNSCLVFC